MNPQSYGFREVLLDQKFNGKWIDVADMQIGSGHSTFQGTKFSDFAGGFTYKSSSSGSNLQNRTIYWRTLNDKLEMIETSLDYNLQDNQVRITFQDSPIVGPITIQETESHLIMLVATVTTVNRIIFNHPKVLNEDRFMKNTQPSIFHHIMNPPLVNLKSFNISENSHNIPVPTSAASIVIPQTGDCVFALAYDTGSSTVIRIDKRDNISNFDLRQSNVFARLLSGFRQSMFSRNTVTTSDSAIGLSFFTVQSERRSYPYLYLATLSMNGHLRLWNCTNFTTFQEWTVLSDIIVDKRFASQDLMNCHMLLRSSKNPKELPTFVVCIPTWGFKFYEIQVNSDPNSPPGSLIMEETLVVEFRDDDIIDFTLSNEYLFVLVSNAEEETDWQVKSFRIDDTAQPRFNLALLEPLPCQDVEIYPSTMDPKNFYCDLIFNKSCFSAPTIYKALGMFANTCNFEKSDTDWERTKEFAQNVVDYEIRLRIDASETNVSDEDYYELSHQFWLNFYNSCVEYHILTIKPLGIFFDESIGMLGIVKKSRVSYLRPTDFLETLYYFPHCAYSPDEETESIDEPEPPIALLIKFMEILNLIESTTDEMHRKKVEKQLRQQRTKIMDVCTDISNLLTLADPHSELLERRHFIPILESKLRDPTGATRETLQQALGYVSSWNESNDGMLVDGLEDRAPVSEYFMASRVGANLAYLVLKQLVQHRFMISRNIMLLHALIVNYFNHLDDEPVKIQLSLHDVVSGTLAVNNTFLLLQMVERNAEIIQECVIDNGMKIANLLRANTSDHLIRGKLVDYSPMKLVEKFCDSHFGNWCIRSRMLGNIDSCVLAYADAAGKACWPSESAGDHPFEEFLISHCQFTALHDYSILLTTHLTTGRRSMKKFYRGLAYLSDGEVSEALVYFKSITFNEAVKDLYFMEKILGVNVAAMKPLVFYQKIISLFQVFQEHSAVQILAETALDACPNQNDKVMMASLAFKSALHMRDYVAAYKYILRIPSMDENNPEGEIREKMASVRTLLRSLLENCEIDTLLALDLRHEFAPGITARMRVEEILESQANLSDPVATDGVYQMLYAYHVTREKYYEGATAMYSRAMRIGEKGGDLRALKAQRDSLLDVLTCLSCLPDRNTPLKVRRVGAHSAVTGGPAIPGSYLTQEDKFTTYEDIIKELQICIAFITMSNVVPPHPVRPTDFAKKASEAVDSLTSEHNYDAALKIAMQWKLSYSPVLIQLARVCSKLVCNINPTSGDPLDYIRHNDTSVLPVTNSSITEIAFRLLESYLKKLEKPFDSTLHRDVTLEILANKIALPRWLIDSYKKINVAQLIHCYLRYGDWEEATDLAVRVIDAALGRVPASEFDPSIHKVDTFEPIPVIPYTVIDMLCHQMELRFEMDNDPEKEKLLKILNTHIDDYCIRVIETRQERAAYMQDFVN
ncbi:unnamed protein product [Allacma fusca]|uniref:Uncharacterized protein n=1 Tax=Allacma fusca TaxID=39272 RepID=A0A8J2P6T7_9HEXA|nr:unnamed protein product [Allacma fusca]